MFIRTRDTTKMYNEKGKSISYDRHNRKGNAVRQFKIENNDITFFDDENVLSKMIPKNDVKVFNDKDIKIIMVGGVILVYQEVPEVPVKFLVYNDEQDEITTIDFDDIEPDKTSILCYDEVLDDFWGAKVIAISTLKYEHIPDENEEKNNKQYLDELKTLSNYITYSEYGLILNGVLVI